VGWFVEQWEVHRQCKGTVTVWREGEVALSENEIFRDKQGYIFNLTHKRIIGN
jgi:hypothetical protein